MSELSFSSSINEGQFSLEKYIPACEVAKALESSHAQYSIRTNNFNQKMSYRMKKNPFLAGTIPTGEEQEESKGKEPFATDELPPWYQEPSAMSKMSTKVSTKIKNLFGAGSTADKKPTPSEMSDISEEPLYPEPLNLNDSEARQSSAINVADHPPSRVVTFEDEQLGLTSQSNTKDEPSESDDLRTVYHDSEEQGESSEPAPSWELINQLIAENAELKRREEERREEDRMRYEEETRRYRVERAIRMEERARNRPKNNLEVGHNARPLQAMRRSEIDAALAAGSKAYAEAQAQKESASDLFYEHSPESDDWTNPKPLRRAPSRLKASTPHSLFNDDYDRKKDFQNRIQELREAREQNKISRFHTNEMSKHHEKSSPLHIKKYEGSVADKPLPKTPLASPPQQSSRASTEDSLLLVKGYETATALKARLNALHALTGSPPEDSDHRRSRAKKSLSSASSSTVSSTIPQLRKRHGTDRVDLTQDSPLAAKGHAGLRGDSLDSEQEEYGYGSLFSTPQGKGSVGLQSRRVISRRVQEANRQPKGINDVKLTIQEYEGLAAQQPRTTVPNNPRPEPKLLQGIQPTIQGFEGLALGQDKQVRSPKLSAASDKAEKEATAADSSASNQAASDEGARFKAMIEMLSGVADDADRMADVMGDVSQKIGTFIHYIDILDSNAEKLIELATKKE
ncbi:uncharacterized protein GGS25DRAFT_498640 [Hypoxylon fragiforme]|uniref:uncharacterized protein n=1 Tax=Hypoxylon fragiforme TaxID=63214 RepID=UPI0020C5EAD5|nr:uncharacterized protein GGS25DRAFT_498640 [Hypoxylon fragiforme]KAI2605924.1 hypothetical protein GGS25DRAFT_498640 [Hypoxylon fragiforme]